VGVNRSNCGLTRALVAVVGELLIVQLHPDENLEVFSDLSGLDRNSLGCFVDITNVVAVAFEFKIERKGFTREDILSTISDRDKIGNLSVPRDRCRAARGRKQQSKVYFNNASAIIFVNVRVAEASHP